MLLHLVVTTIIYVTGLFVYVKLTPHREIDLIREGNLAAAISFGALVVGLAIPLAVCLKTAFSIGDILFWGVTTVVLQMFLFRLTDMILRGLSGRIEEGEVASAVTLAAFKLAGSIVLAAALGDPYTL